VINSTTIRSVIRTWTPALSGVACLGLGAGLISIYGFFVQPLSQEFGVGVATLNMGPVALLLVPGVVAPVIGKLVDSQPIRRIMLIGATLAMCALLLVSQAPTILLAGVAFLLFALGLTLYGPVVVNSLLVKIFVGREARALAIAAMGISLATAVLPPFVAYLLDIMGWRSALALLALLILVILWLSISAGIPAGVQQSVGAADAPPEIPPEIPPVYRNRNFWLIGFCVALGFNVSIVLAICYPLHFVSQGFTLSQAGWFLSMAGISGMVGKGLVALFADNLSRYAKWLAFAILGFQAVGLLWLADARTMAEVVPVICLLGMTGGAFLPMHPYLNSQYFDAGVMGRISGAQMPLFLPFGFVAAPLAGYFYDRDGNYLLVLSGLAVAMTVAAILAALLPSPQAPDDN
jgi:predicted MFS family arabinose efflux permease